MTSNQQQGEGRHTPEPWRVSDDGHRIYAGEPADSIAEECRRNVASFGGHSNDGTKQRQDRANARRIVQCVNACQGIPDPKAAIQAVRKALKYLEYAEWDDIDGEYECPQCGATDGKPHNNHCLLGNALAQLTPKEQSDGKE